MKSLACAALLALAACGGSSAKVPAIAITSPAGGSSVALGTDADKTVSIGYTLTNFETRAPGACAGTPNCGHLHVLIDGPTCTPTGQPYNNNSISSTTAAALFGKCDSSVQVGSHTVSLELHDDVHAAVDDAAGHPVAAQVTFTTHN